MKKLFLFTTLFLVLFLGVACKKDKPIEEQVTIKFACYRECGSVSNENRYPLVHAIREFERQNKNIKVEILRAPLVPNDDETGTVEQPWVDYLASQAAANRFPDVFNANSMPSAISQGWALDITDLTKADSEYNLMYEDFRKSGEILNRVYAIPYMYEFFGYFINKSLFDDANVDYPTFGFTIDEMLTASKAIVRLQDGGNSILGMSGAAEMFNYMPAQFNSDYGWYAYNTLTNEFDLDSDEFRRSIELNLSISKDKTHVNDALTEAERKIYFGSTDWWYPWWNNRLGLQFDYSVMFTNLINSKNKGEITFDFDFIGIPKGTSSQEARTPVKPSYLMVGKNTEHKEEAYELIKWLSFSPEGYEYKMKASREVEDSLPIISPPLTTDERSHKAFFTDTYPDYPEWRKVIENGNFYFDLWATMPGFEEARWLMTYKEGITMADINIQIGVLGTEQIGDHAQEMKRLMNGKIAEVNEKLRTILGITD